jgi:hypothetical protein
MMALGTVSSSVLYNQTFTGLGQNTNTSFVGNGRKKGHVMVARARKMRE